MHKLSNLFEEPKTVFNEQNIHTAQFWHFLCYMLGDEKDQYVRLVFSEFLPFINEIKNVSDLEKKEEVSIFVKNYLDNLQKQLNTEPYIFFSQIYEMPIFDALNHLKDFPLKYDLSFYQSALTSPEKEVFEIRKRFKLKFLNGLSLNSILNFASTKPNFNNLRQIFKEYEGLFESKGLKNNLKEFSAILLKDYLRRVFYEEMKQFISTSIEENTKKVSKLTMPQKNLIMHFLLSRHDIDNRKGKQKAELIRDLCEIEGFENLYKAVRNPFETGNENWRIDDLKAIKPYFENLGMDEIVKEIENQKRK